MVRRLIERSQLSISELALLSALLERKVVTTKQMASLASRFDPAISARGVHRLLTRMSKLKLVKCRDYVVSTETYGYRAKIWRITKLGIARIIADENESFRTRKFWKDGFPSQTIPHILAINKAELAVMGSGKNIGRIEHEPVCHRKFRKSTNIYNTGYLWLKPDLFTVVSGRWIFFEIDMGSERTSRIVEKCRLYAVYLNASYDEWKPTQPRIVWAVQTEARRSLLLSKIREKLPKYAHLFKIVLLSEVSGVI